MATAKKTKFQSNLEKSHKDIRGQRANLLNRDAERKMRKEVENTEERKEDLEMAILNLSDLGPDSTTTLKVTRDGFDAISWSKQLINKKVELFIVERELKIAQETYNEFFGQ